MDDTPVGFVAGCIVSVFIVCLIFAGCTSHWLSPKIIDGQVFYYGADFSQDGMNVGNHYWKVTKVQYKLE